MLLINGGRKTILVVEDHEGVRELTRLILENEGYTVLVAGNGTEAMSCAEQHRDPIPLIVTDALMPGMSLPELTQRMKALNPECLILVISGHPNEVIASRRFDEDGHAFLQKPFAPDRLVTIVRDMLASTSGALTSRTASAS